MQGAQVLSRPHTGRSIGHCVELVHATQRPALAPIIEHDGAAVDGQSVSCVAMAHARQALRAASQIGVAPEHWLLSTHATQRPALAPAVAHAGVAPVQSVAVHARQRPAAVSHTGVASPHCASRVHCTQRPAFMPVVAHTGVGARHVASETHSTQVPAATSHTVAAPAVHCVSAVHCTQRASVEHIARPVGHIDGPVAGGAEGHPPS